MNQKIFLYETCCEKKYAIILSILCSTLFLTYSKGNIKNTEQITICKSYVKSSSPEGRWVWCHDTNQWK